MQRIQSKKFWLIIGIIVGIAAIGLIVMVITGQWGKITADAAEKWTLASDTGITINISDGVEEVKAGDVLNYRIDFAYEGQKISSEEELELATKGLIQRLNLNVDSSNVQLAMVGYLASGKVLLSDSMIKNKDLAKYEFPRQVGLTVWLLKYPNFETVINQLKAGTNGTLNIPAVVPQNIGFQNNKIQGGIYVYLTTRKGFVPQRILVAKAIDEDTFIPSTTTTPTPTVAPSGSTSSSPTPTPSTSPKATITSLQISPQSLGFVLGGQQISFTAIATYSDGTKKEITRSKDIKWQAVTNSPGDLIKEIGTITSYGVFRAANYSGGGIMRVESQPARGKITVEFDNKKAETSEFSVIPIIRGL